ncbi:MAG: hypothetical protein WCH44_16955, partial [Betaproteobacteria bacterium]
MKVMDSRSGLGAKRRHSGGYGEHWQQRHGREGALSCFDISGLEYPYSNTEVEEHHESDGFALRPRR